MIMFRRSHEAISQFGTGKVDFKAVFAKLRSVGFNGPIMVEGVKVGAPHQATPPWADAGKLPGRDPVADGTQWRPRFFGDFGQEHVRARHDEFLSWIASSHREQSVGKGLPHNGGGTAR